MRRSLQFVIIGICLAAIGWFFKLGFSTYFDWPPKVYSETGVYNLTSADVSWDVFYGAAEECEEGDCHLLATTDVSSFQKQMVLPAREFPLKDYKKGDLIFYRTWIQVPPGMIDDADPLMFHSIYIWAKEYDFYVNGQLVESGTTELLNLAIPRTLVPEDGRLFLAFKIDPGDLPYQGIAHRGDLVLGPKTKLMPTAFFAQERKTVFYLWFLLPRLAFCIMFMLLFFAISQRADMFFFCLYGFLGASGVFFASGYAEALPFVPSTPAHVLFRNAATLVLIRFFLEFLGRDLRSLGKIHIYAMATIMLGLIGGFFIFDQSKAMVISEAVSATLRPFTMAFAIALALRVMLRKGKNERKPVAQLLAVVCGLGLCIQLFETTRWVMDMMGKSGNMAGIYLYLSWIFDLVLFVVLSAVIAKEFGYNIAARKRYQTQLLLVQERLELAQSVQKMLMPADQKGSRGAFDFRIFFSPAEQMSGDWYNYWDRKDEYRLFMGDVVGKGPSAALAVSVVAGAVAECKRDDCSMDETFQRINQRLFDLFGGHVTTTMAAIRLSLKTEECDIYTSGSTGWIALSQDSAKYIPLNGRVLGHAEEVKVGHAKLDFSDYNHVFSFTDGCLEGARPMRQLMKDLKEESAVELRQDIQAVYDQVVERGKDVVHDDDKSMIAISRAPIAPEQKKAS